MTVLYRASVPVYETECDECHSVIRYQKAETLGNQGYIKCPVCGVDIRALTIIPVIVLDDQEQKKRNTTHADRIRAMTDEELAEWISMIAGRERYRDVLPEAWLEYLRKEADND